MRDWRSPDNDTVASAYEYDSLSEQGLSVLEIALKTVQVSNFEQVTQQEVNEMEMQADMEHPKVQRALGLTPGQEAQAQAEQAADYNRWEEEYRMLVREDADRLEGLAVAWDSNDTHLPLASIGQEMGEIIGRYPGLLDRMDPLPVNVKALKDYAYGTEEAAG